METGKQKMSTGRVKSSLPGFIMKGLLAFTKSHWQLFLFIFISPVNNTIVVNDRWGRGILCKHGDFLTCQDRYMPKKLMKKKWENAMTLDLHSWGYSRDSKSIDYITRIDLLETLVRTVRYLNHKHLTDLLKTTLLWFSYGGNILINIGPTSDGRLPPIMEERLLELGVWLNVFGEAIYKTKPWKYQSDTLAKKVW